MPQPRQIRLFLSSTFRDMESERHELLTRVFPLFRQRCLERQVVFSEIDLRWGITEEDAQNGQTVQICLEEIARCRALGVPPFFIGFIGERYGWVPQPENLEHYWQSAQHGDNRWAARIETALAQGISVTELEMRVGFMDDADDDIKRRVQIYFRHPDLTAAIAGGAQSEAAGFYERDPAGQQKLAALKSAIREHHAASIGVDGYRDISEFGEQVLRFLHDQLDALFPAQNVPDEQQLRQAQQQSYALSRREGYVPLTALRQHVATWAANTLDAMLSESVPDRDALNRLALVGPSGRGKSAFMADLAAGAFPHALVVAHFVGADGDNSPEGWRERVLAAIAPWLPDDAAIPPAGEARWAAFPALVNAAQARAGQPFIFLLDAVNQFSPPQEGVSRLDALRFSRGTLLIATSTEALTSQWPALAFPEMDAATRRAAIDCILQHYSKKLPAVLVEQLAAAPACGNALFLRLVLEELRLHASHESLSARLASLLSYTDAGELFLALLNETDRDFRAEGEALASHAATLIAVSRAGLSHRDLAALLAPYLHGSAPRMADQPLLRLIARLAPFCLNDDGRLRITHTLFTHALATRSPLMMPSRRALVAWFAGNDAFSLAERAFQWLTLDEEERLVQTLGRIDDFTTLQQHYPELTGRIMLALGAGRSTLSLPLNALAESWNSPHPDARFTPAVNPVSAWFLQRGFWLIGMRWSALMPGLMRKLFPQDFISYMAAVNNLGLFYRLLARYDQAESLFRDALTLMRKTLPPGHPDLAIVLNNLAGVYGSQGRDAEAEPLLLEAQRGLSEEDGIQYANITQSLGECYQRLEQYDKAETLMRQALAVRERLQGKSHPDLLGLKRSLGGLWMEMGRYGEAEPLLEEVLRQRRTILPPAHPDIAVSLNELGELYYRQQQGDKAAPLFEEMLAIKRESLPPGHPGIAEGLQYLAELRRAQGRMEEAEALFLEGLTILEHSLPSGDENLLFARQYLIDLYIEQEQHGKTIPQYQALIAAQDEQAPPDSPQTLQLLLNLALACLGEGRLEDAEAAWRQWLDRQQETLAPEDPHGLDVMRNIACICKEQGRYEEAKTLMLRLVALRFEHHPDDDGNNAQSLYDLGDVYYLLEEYQQAEFIYRWLFNLVDPVMQDDNPEKVKLLQRLVELGRRNVQAERAPAPPQPQIPPPEVTPVAKSALSDRLRGVWRKLTR